MKRLFVSTLLVAFILLNAAPVQAGGKSKLSGFIRLQIGNSYLQFGSYTERPSLVVYDEIVYVRTTRTETTLVPSTIQVPVTQKVLIPAGAAEILLNGETVQVPVSNVSRIEEIVTGYETRTVYTRQTVETVVYVPSIQPVTYYRTYTPLVLHTGGTWVCPGRWEHRDNRWNRTWKTHRAPHGVIHHSGIYRYKSQDGKVRKLNAILSKESTSAPVRIKSSTTRTSGGVTNKIAPTRTPTLPSTVPSVSKYSKTPSTTNINTKPSASRISPSR